MRSIERYVLAVLYLKGEISMRDLKQNIQDYRIQRGCERVPTGQELGMMLAKSEYTTKRKEKQTTLWSISGNLPVDIFNDVEKIKELM